MDGMGISPRRNSFPSAIGSMFIDGWCGHEPKKKEHFKCDRLYIFADAHILHFPSAIGCMSIDGWYGHEPKKR